MTEFTRRFSRSVAQLEPRLLILDPFVRLHRIDENAAGEVAPLLAYLRELQRRHALSVLVVHHAKKSAGRLRAGHALRGPPSSMPGATPTCTCAAQPIAPTLTIEHRAAPSPPAITLALKARSQARPLPPFRRLQSAA